jgi:UDP-N-acetylglucosamine pyrophosphorylase
MTSVLAKAAALDNEERAALYFEELKPLMAHIRKHVDDLERVGNFVIGDGRVMVVEYSDLPEEHRAEVPLARPFGP